MTIYAFSDIRPSKKNVENNDWKAESYEIECSTGSGDFQTTAGTLKVCFK